ncbi:MAG: tRNA-specific adenosine deaminase [Candidatus Azosocius agrarius]|nr:MAG: tRNA-specific adenosine deaminase [Gammaproteobacteria bacterium]
MNFIKIINFHKQWMNCAINQAKIALLKNEIPIGAIIIKNNKIISKGNNQTLITNNPIGHAEIIAIQKASIIQKNYKIPNAYMYITKEPCLMCLGAIINFKIKHIIFGSYNINNEFNKNNILHTYLLKKNITYTGGIYKNICDSLLKYFIKKNII